MPTSVPIHLSDDERAHLQTFVHRGRANARTLTRAHILLKLDAGWSDAAIRDAFTVGASTLWRVRQRYTAGGLEAVLHDQRQARRRQARRRQALAGEQVAHLVAIACTDAPRGHDHWGHDHWTLRLLAGKAVELGYVTRISPETVRQVLKKTS
jgi:transposase